MSTFATPKSTPHELLAMYTISVAIRIAKSDNVFLLFLLFEPSSLVLSDVNRDDAFLDKGSV